MNDNTEFKRASGTRSKKRKFTGNMHTRKLKELSQINESASGKKISMCSDEMEAEPERDFKGYRFIDIGLVFSNFEKYLSCKICGSDITLKENIVSGLSSKITIYCQKCTDVCTFRNSRMLGSKNSLPEINQRFVYAMRTIGKGYAGIKLFSGVMDLPQPVSKKTYNASVKKLLICSNKVAQWSMKDAADQEVQLTGSQSVIVSGDGTWKTRGHTSRIGVCTIIGDKSGKVIDTEVLSSYCKECDTWKDMIGSTEYNNWKIEHEKDCLINHVGSAGKMEVVGMIRIFQRSETKRNVKYIGYIGDGDTKTFQAITEVQPYGSKITVSKIECVGHIQKRMGTRLRKLKQSGVKCSDGKSIGGKGRLTDKQIDKLTVYYGNAIREHKNSLANMRKAAWAVYFHTRSTDLEPLHSFCPLGSDSWCNYQKAVAKGTEKSFVHKVTIPAIVMDVIKPVFKDLIHPKLLGRCLGGKTQNNNESLNSLIWKSCPKTLGTGRRIAEIATSEAVILFNDGNTGRLKVMEQFGLSAGYHAEKCLTLLDKQRVATGELWFNRNTKEMRMAKRRNQKGISENFLLQEGEMYAAGAF